MGEPTRHPKLRRATEFTAAHGDFLSLVFDAFYADGEWPELEKLQRDLDRAAAGADIDVAELAWRMPDPLGFVEQERVVLRVRALAAVPGAQELLDSWYAALAFASRAWGDDDEPVLRWSDLTGYLGVSDHHAMLVVKLLTREGWAFGSGGGDGTEWWREVRRGVRIVRGSTSAAELLAARDDAEYPHTPGALSGVPAEGAAAAPMVPAAISGIPDMNLTPSPDNESKPDPDRERKVMVVVGRDDAANEAMFGFLRAIDLRPLEWPQLVAETEVATPYIGAVLDRAMEVAQAVVVLFTPDDLVQLRPALVRTSDGDEERRPTAQPRPNVLYEAGLAFGRHPARTVLVEHGELRGLTDLFGLHVVRLERGARALHELAQRLKNAGCRVNTSGEEWLDADRFPPRPELESGGVSLTAPPASRAAGTTGDGGAAPQAPSALERLVDEILRSTGHAPAGDVVEEIARRIEGLDGPTRGEFLVGLPGRKLDVGSTKRVLYELLEHGVLRRNDGPERGFVLGKLP